MFFEKKKWVNRIKIHDEVVTSLAPNVLLRKFSLNSSITPMFTICTHIALLAFEMDDNSMIFKVYDFFFSIETRRSVGTRRIFHCRK